MSIEVKDWCKLCSKDRLLTRKLIEAFYNGEGCRCLSSLDSIQRIISRKIAQGIELQKIKKSSGIMEATEEQVNCLIKLFQK